MTDTQYCYVISDSDMEGQLWRESDAAALAALRGAWNIWRKVGTVTVYIMYEGKICVPFSLETIKHLHPAI